MGDTYNGVGHSEEALAVFAQAFDLAEKDLNVPGQGRAQLGMAAASDLGRHSHALSMFQKPVGYLRILETLFTWRHAEPSDMYAASHEESLNALKKQLTWRNVREIVLSKDLQTVTLEALGEH